MEILITQDGSGTSINVFSLFTSVTRLEYGI